MNADRRLVLDRPRDLSALLRDALALYGRHPAAFIALAAVVVVPVQLIVSGLGLEHLTTAYDESPAPAEAVIPTAVSFLVVAPLVTAICIRALQSIDRGEGPALGPALREGFEAFNPLFAAVVLAAAGIALGVLAFVIPGIYVAVRWFFVPQTVVIEGARGADALRRSGELVQGAWWRTLGVVLVANVAAVIPAAVIQLPFVSIADQTDRQLFALVGETLTEMITLPFLALISTLLYYDLRARRATGYRP